MKKERGRKRRGGGFLLEGKRKEKKEGEKGKRKIKRKKKIGEKNRVRIKK